MCSGSPEHLLEVGTWVKSKLSTPLVLKRWTLVLICGFCNVPLMFTVVFQFEVDGLNSLRCQLSLRLEAMFYY